jgi:hypothetical protein
MSNWKIALEKDITLDGVYHLTIPFSYDTSDWQYVYITFDGTGYYWLDEIQFTN